MKITYLANQYPGIRHSFIRREILALERARIAVARFAVRRPRHEVVGEADRTASDSLRFRINDTRWKG